ncbi:MAG: twitching motility protein PilT [Hydrocarboniphaga sp.]|nr:twitching motility protein PilT [Hydrocarboniphaga sp.]
MRAWFDARAGETLAISDWTLTEFASAMGIKVRDKGLKAGQAHKACALMEKLAADSLKVFTPTRGDYSRATEHLGHHALGLRAGDALHLAIAQNEDAECLYTLDRRLIEAARKLKVKAASPI